MHQSVVLGQLLRLGRVARVSWGLATREYNRLVVSSPIKNIEFRFGRSFPFPFPFSFPRFHVFQLPQPDTLQLLLVALYWYVFYAYK